MLADGGQHLVKHPALKPLRRGQLAVDDQPVHIALRDKRHANFAVRTLRVRYVAFHDAPAMTGKRIAGIAVPQRNRNIQTAEQVFPVFLNDPDAAELRVFENFHLVHVVPPLA